MTLKVPRALPWVLSFWAAGALAHAQSGASGRWDKGRTRVLFADRGDIVMVDAAGARRAITRTTAAESSPRWAHRDTAITYVRDGNLFLAPLDGSGVQQLTDNGPKKPDQRLTDSQKFIRDEERKLLESVREARDRKQKADEKERLDKLPGLFEDTLRLARPARPT